MYYEDTDSGGVVYHASYLRFLERGRTEWLRELGFQQSRLSEELDRVFVVRSLAIEYRKPARLDEALQVTTRARPLQRARLLFDQHVTRMPDGPRLCSARVEVVCMDTDGRPRPLPRVLRERLNDVG